MTWDAIIGQERVKRILRTAFEAGRIPHALLFHGPEGVGKDAAALMLARALNCERKLWEPCGICRSCRQMDSLQHPSVTLVFPLPRGKGEKREDDPFDKLPQEARDAVREEREAKARNPYHRIAVPNASEIRIPSIRSLRRDAVLRTRENSRAVVIISQAHRMNEEASNALLKTLEEPGGNLLLILTTGNREALRPTILSRCQQIHFDPLGEEEILEGLRPMSELSRDQLLVAARLSNGSFTRAIELLEEESLNDRKRILEFLRAAWSEDAEAIVRQAQYFHDLNDRQAVAEFLEGLEWWFRDVSAIQEGFGDRILNVDLQKPLHDFSDHFRNVDADSVIKILEESIGFTQKNSQIALVIVHVALEIRHSLASRRAF